jgi:glycosyltransferase involved in cell wall biosynthesis
MKFLKRVPLIYDAHECETEVEGMTGLRRCLTRPFERFALRFVDSFIVVSDSIGQWYLENYAVKRVRVLRNIPVTPHGSQVSGIDLRTRLGLRQQDMLFLYQGVLSENRGVRILLDAFRTVQHDKHLVMLGFGPMVETVRRAAAEQPNVHYLEAVSPEELLSYTAGCDVGLHLIPNSCLNHYYCLPNKIFEYLHAGLGVIASDFPEISKVLRESGAGIPIAVGVNDLKEVVERITWKEVQLLQADARKARTLYDGRAEQRILLDEYSRLKRRGVD